MNNKRIAITTIITAIIVTLFALNFIGNKFVLRAENIYKVYIDGEIIGYITNDKELYEIINKHQQEIMDKYNVKNVYPPENFEIVKSQSYNVTISSAEEIYSRIAELESFTIEGYIISIKDDEKKQTINVLDRKIFDSAIKDFVLAFISEDEYENYINNTQPAIKETGMIFENMYFDENLTIKRGYIDVNDRIFVDEKELSQYLLFGDNAEIKSYTVREGDTIDSISDSNKLNPQEFLIANPSYTSKDSLLAIGAKVNITLINPVLTFSYDVNEVSDTQIDYDKKIEYDSTKEAGFEEITTKGVKGVTRITSKYTVKNGETQAGVEILAQSVITEKVDEIITRGGTRYNPISGQYVDTGETWGWPTNRPYILTSGYEWRWGVFHYGIDISGTGTNSPIYAVLDGVVISSGWEGQCGRGGGYCVVIQHANGYCTMYAHMYQGSLRVKEGDTVSRGQIIGGMGTTGNSTGVHLHFSVSNGVPYTPGFYFINPFNLWS